MFERGRDALSGYRPVKIGLDPARDLLYARLNDRASRMFDGGLLDQVRGLLSSGVPPEAKAIRIPRIQTSAANAARRITAEQALESTQVETRHYAKRQLTWFRKEQGVHWIAGFGEDPRVQAEALAILQRANAG